MASASPKEVVVKRIVFTFQGTQHNFDNNKLLLRIRFLVPQHIMLYGWSSAYLISADGEVHYGSVSLSASEVFIQSVNKSA